MTEYGTATPHTTLDNILVAHVQLLSLYMLNIFSSSLLLQRMLNCISLFQYCFQQCFLGGNKELFYSIWHNAQFVLWRVEACSLPVFSNPYFQSKDGSFYCSLVLHYDLYSLSIYCCNSVSLWSFLYLLMVVFIKHLFLL